MEDIKAYIETGILELYVLGDLSQGERLEVEQMAEKHPEVRAELYEIEKAMEDYADSLAIAPVAVFRQRVIESLPVRETGAEAEVIPLRRSAGWKYAFAACLVLLLLSVAEIVSLNDDLQQSRVRIAELDNSNRRFAGQVNFMNRQLGVMRDPQFKLVRLAGTQNAPSATMMVAFNPVRQEVMIDMGAVRMPANDSAHQYQLWAMVDNKPVDLGVFDAPGAAGMKRMRSVQGAQAFAVTLEPRGGSVAPTMEQMVVIGTI